jgi:hypothetical protein
MRQWPGIYGACWFSCSLRAMLEACLMFHVRIEGIVAQKTPLTQASQRTTVNHNSPRSLYQSTVVGVVVNMLMIVISSCGLGYVHADLGPFNTAHSMGAMITALSSTRTQQ